MKKQKKKQEMDELLFRAEQTVEAVQFQLQSVKESSVRLAQQCSNEISQFATRHINDNTLTIIKNEAFNLWKAIAEILKKTKDFGNQALHVDVLLEQLRKIMRDEVCRNNLFYIFVGLSFGTTGGLLIGMWITRTKQIKPMMKSIAYTGHDNVTICHTTIPSLVHPSDILIRVRAVSVNRLDERICEGYGRTLRRILRRHNGQRDNDFPLIIGRACSGIVEEIGSGVKNRLEIGDEVWLASPWCLTGLGSEFVVAPEWSVGRKPFIIGFEGAASLPYSGCAALNALNNAGINEINCSGKRILIQDGCSPVGCVLTQLVRKWGGIITATCHIRSVPVLKALGAEDIIGFYSESEIDNDEPLFEERNIFLKELSTRAKYDVVFFTSRTLYDRELVRPYIKPFGVIVNTVEERPASDDYDLLQMFFYSIFVQLKLLSAKYFNYTPHWGGPQLCNKTLDRLAGYINDGIVQTVVDQVYTPQDAENALVHVCSPKAIGSTIVTFR